MVMSEAVDAARNLLSTTKSSVDEWELQQELREVTDEVVVPDRRQQILEQLRSLKSRGSLDGEVEHLVELVEEWPESRLDYVRLRLRAAAKAVLIGREGVSP